MRRTARGLATAGVLVTARALVAGAFLAAWAAAGACVPGLRGHDDGGVGADVPAGEAVESAEDGPPPPDTGEGAPDGGDAPEAEGDAPVPPDPAPDVVVPDDPIPDDAIPDDATPDDADRGDDDPDHGAGPDADDASPDPDDAAPDPGDAASGGDGPAADAGDSAPDLGPDALPCAPGPCCDKGVLRSVNEACETWQMTACDGGCAGYVRYRLFNRFCPGDAETCTGEVAGSGWILSTVCTVGQRCVESAPGAASCEDCPGGCADGACLPPACEDGPCCDGQGGFRDAGFECASVTETRCTASCAGAFQRRTSRTFCSGHGPACDGARVEDDWGTLLHCGAGWTCDAEGARCTFCAGGCDESGCLPCAWAWSAVSTAGEVPPASSRHAAVWVPAESRMLVAGGSPGQTADAHLYDPLADEWSVATGCGVAGRAIAVWTGADVLIWSGPLLRYDPAAGACTALPAAPAGLTAAAGATAVWTGSRLVVWGGDDAGTSPGAVFDPAAGVWTPVSGGPDAPSPRRDHVATWAVDRVFVWGGTDAGGPTSAGALYDPGLDAWAPTSQGAGCPSARTGAAAVWTGSRVLVWGGEGPGGPLADGGAYDPAADAWTAIPADGAPVGRSGHSMTWTGGEAIVWGGGRFEDADWVESGDGGRYDPASGAWAPIPADGAPSPRAWHSAVWTGRGMVVWGGQVVEGITPGVDVRLADGGRYRCMPP